MSWKLRCDLKISSVLDIVTYVSSCVTHSAYVVEKIDTNPHLHFYLSGGEGPTRYHLRKLCGAGNAGYSLKQMDEEYPIEYLSYMMKEGEIIWNNVPQEKINEAVAWQAKVKAEMLEKKEKRKTRLQKIEEYIIGKGLDVCWNGSHAMYITRNVILYYKENELLVREFAMVSQIQTLCLKMVEGYSSQLEDNIMKRVTGI